MVGQCNTEIVTGRNHGILSIYINIITVSTGYASECGLQKVIFECIMLGWTFLRKLKVFLTHCGPLCFSSCWELDIGNILKKVVGLSFYIVHFFSPHRIIYKKHAEPSYTSLSLFPNINVLSFTYLTSECMGHLTEIMNRGECTDFSQSAYMPTLS